MRSLRGLLVLSPLALCACTREVASIESCAERTAENLELRIVRVERVEGTLSGGQVTYSVRKEPDAGARLSLKLLPGCQVKSLDMQPPALEPTRFAASSPAPLK